MHLEVLIENPRGAERRQLRVDGAVSIGRGEGCTLRIDSHLDGRPGENEAHMTFIGPIRH